MPVASPEAVVSARQYTVRRRFPRHYVSVPMTLYRFSAAGPLLAAHGLSLDVSKGGAAAVMCGPPRVGETVAINLQLLDGPFEALAIVRHSDDARSGFEFLDVAPDVQLKMEASIQESQVSPWPVNPFFRKVV